MGTEQPLQIHLQKYLDHVETDSPMPPPKFRLNGKDFGSGTPNHKGLRVVCDLVDDAPGALVRLANFLAMQEERGLMCAAEAIETNTASHWQLHAAWAGVALVWLARANDIESQEALIRWWRSAFALCAACEIPGAKDKSYPEPLVWGPGWRGKIKDSWVASNPARDLCYSLMMGAVHRGEEGEPYRKRLPAGKRALWKNKYNNGPRALRLLEPASLAALLPPEGWVPPLPYPFHAGRTFETGFVAWFDVPESDKTDVARLAGKNIGDLWVEQFKPPGFPPTPFALLNRIDYPAVPFERS